MPPRRRISREEREFNERIGRRICQLRKERRLSQTALATAVGIGQPQLFDYEVGRVRCSAFRLTLIARRLNVPLRDLVPDNALLI